MNFFSLFKLMEWPCQNRLRNPCKLSSARKFVFNLVSSLSLSCLPCRRGRQRREILGTRLVLFVAGWVGNGSHYWTVFVSLPSLLQKPFLILIFFLGGCYMHKRTKERKRSCFQNETIASYVTTVKCKRKLRKLICDSLKDKSMKCKSRFSYQPVFFHSSSYHSRYPCT